MRIRHKIIGRGPQGSNITIYELSYVMRETDDIGNENFRNALEKAYTNTIAQLTIDQVYTVHSFHVNLDGDLSRILVVGDTNAI